VLSLLDELEQPAGGHGGPATDVWPTALPPAWPADAALFAPPPLPRAPLHSSKVVPLPPGAGGWYASAPPGGPDVPMVDSISMEPPGGVGPCLPGAPASLQRMAPTGMYPPRVAMAMLPHIRTHTIPPPPLPALHHPDLGAAAQLKGKGRKGAAARSAGAPRSGGGRSSMSDGGNGAASAPAPRTSHGAFGGGWTPDATTVSAGGPFSAGGGRSGSLGRTPLSGGDDEDPEVKRERRILANRASAARSRQRKLEHVQELECNVATLQAQLEDAQRGFASTVAARDAILAHNEALRARALLLAEECGPGFTWTL
jgi:hypothetical protein